MATTVNVKMGVTGVAQFKQSMQQTRNSLKTVDEQLKLNEKQFKATGDSETYMEQKTQLLNTKMAEQEKIIDQAEKALETMASQGVDKSSKAFQDMQQQLLKAKGDLLDTSTELDNIETSSDNASGGLADLDAQLNNIGKNVSFSTVTSGIDSITDGLKNAAAKAIELGKRLVQATLGAGGWADEIATEAAKAGLDTKTYQQMLATANLVDTTVDSILSSKQKLATATQKDNDEMKAIFAQLGIVTERYGEVRNLDDIFWETGEALMKIDNEAQRADWGKKLFGQWRELIPLFSTGRQEYEELRNSQSYVDDEHLKSLTEMDDQYQKLNHEIETLKNEFLAELAPSITNVMEILTGLVTELNKYLDTKEGKEMMQALSDAVTGMFTDLSKIDPKEALKSLKGVISSIKEAFLWVKDNKDGIVKALGGIVTGWAALKLTGGALKVLEFINGIKGLTLGSGTSAAAAAGKAAGASFASGFVDAFVAAAPALASFLGITAVAIAPALIAQSADEQRIEQLRQQRLENAENLDEGTRQFQTRAANALGLKRDENGKLVKNIFGQNWIGGSEAEVEDILMGMKNYSDLQKSVLHNMLNGSYSSWSGNSTWNDLMAYWNGEPMEQGALNAILENVTDAYDKMAQQSDDVNGSTTSNTNASNAMADAANNMMSLPELVQSAVQSGMSGIQIYLNGELITEYVNTSMGEEIELARK